MKTFGTSGKSLPTDHPERFALMNEAHARPTEDLPKRARISYIVLFGELGADPVSDLCARYECEPPEDGANHFSVDLGPFRMKWERHTEFTRYWFFVSAEPKEKPFSTFALAAVPQDWLSGLSGEIMVANHVELLPLPAGKLDEAKLGKEFFDGNMLIGADLTGGLARAYSDFRAHADGFGRVLVYERDMAPRQRGRTVQRLLEIDTYRMLALLAFAMTRRLAPLLSSFEQELTGITAEMRGADETKEPALLDRLTLLHADIVQEHTRTQFRFSAARAYSQLVEERISELREHRIEGLQTFGEFIDRRLTPAMRTCEAAANRLGTISERVARATQLLSTRVDISREKQNQALLESMNRRARMQLRLQQTVEGLSIAAITYYIVGLVNYMAKALKTSGHLPWSETVVTAASIPIVALVVAWGTHRVKQSLNED